VDLCILFVDDDEANLTVFEATFEGVFPIVLARSAAEALEKMADHEVAVLITDQRMPEVTGVQLLEQVHKIHPETVRILITAYSDLGAAISAINQGHVHRYMRKPWVPDELRAVLTESLNIYEMNNKMRAMEQRLVETERLYALGVVAAGLAHELRNPVAWISDNLSMAQDAIRALLRESESAPLSAGALKDSLEELDEEISDCLVGVARIMDVVRGVEMPHRQTFEDTTDLGEVLRLSLKILRREIQKAGQVRLDVRTVPRVRGSTTKLGQVVLNVLTNAAQALAEAKPQAGLITIRLFYQNELVILEVSDNGPGIEPKALPKIFDPLYTARPSGGSGLGLAISRTIAEELGGRLEVENQASGGAVFRLAIPAAD